MEPSQGEVVAVPVIGAYLAAVVVAACEDAGGVALLAVEPSDGTEVSLGAVLLAVAPKRGGLIGKFSMIRDGLQLSACHAVEDSEILAARLLFALAALVVGLGVVAGKEDIVALSVNGTGGCLQHDLTVAVAVEVPGCEVCGVGGIEHVMSGVKHPEACAVELVAGVEGGRGGAAAGGVLLIGRSPLEDDVILTVAVHVAERGIVGRIGGPSSGGVCGRSALQGDIFHLSVPRPRLLCLQDVAVGIDDFELVEG